MKDQYYLESIEQLQAIAEPTRWQILNLLVKKSMTGSQLGRVLKIPRPLAHYHLKILEKVGLVEFVHEQPSGSVVEKYFRAIASQLRTDHLVDAYRQNQNNDGRQTGEALRGMMEAMLEVVRIDLSRPDIYPFLSKAGFNFQEDYLLTQSQVYEFIKTMRALGEQYKQLDIKNHELLKQHKGEPFLHVRTTWLNTPGEPILENGTHWRSDAQKD